MSLRIQDLDNILVYFSKKKIVRKWDIVFQNYFFFPQEILSVLHILNCHFLSNFYVLLLKEKKCMLKDFFFHSKKIAKV